MYLEYPPWGLHYQGNHKRNMRESEEETLNAEKYASLAWLSGDAYPGQELANDWKKMTVQRFPRSGRGIGNRNYL